MWGGRHYAASVNAPEPGREGRSVSSRQFLFRVMERCAMGFLDKAKEAAQQASVKAKEAAEQAQKKLEEKQGEFNERQQQRAAEQQAGARPPGPPAPPPRRRRPSAVRSARAASSPDGHGPQRPATRAGRARTGR